MKTRSPLINRTSWLVIGCLALLVLATTGSQCAKVADPAGTRGLDYQLSPEFAECIQGCNDIAREARSAENALHLENIKACGGDPDCLEAEEERHEAVLDQIVRDMQACKDVCQHEQGGGSGGD
jgi:hypothetical protein